MTTSLLQQQVLPRFSFCGRVFTLGQLNGCEREKESHAGARDGRCDVKPGMKCAACNGRNIPKTLQALLHNNNTIRVCVYELIAVTKDARCPPVNQ